MFMMFAAVMALALQGCVPAVTGTSASSPYANPQQMTPPQAALEEDDTTPPVPPPRSRSRNRTRDAQWTWKPDTKAAPQPITQQSRGRINGGIQSFTHTVTQPFGGDQSPDEARTAAILRAKREVLEQAGTYLESLTEVQEGRLTRDEIIALSAAVFRTEILSEKRYATDDAFGLRITMRIQIDPSVLQVRIKDLSGNQKQIRKLKASQKREEALLNRIAALEKRLQEAQSEQNQHIVIRQSTSNSVYTRPVSPNTRRDNKDKETIRKATAALSREISILRNQYQQLYNKLASTTYEEPPPPPPPLWNDPPPPPPRHYIPQRPPPRHSNFRQSSRHRRPPPRRGGGGGRHR
ncbi:MAG: hypothetical protein HQL53_02515 [Magnetococcales bacterium]|nr:hypothetical protein [Magnetococcales bacterium]